MKSMQINGRLKEEEIVLLGLLRKELFEGEYLPPQDTPWDKVVKECMCQWTMLTAFSHSEQLEIPTEIRQLIKKQSAEYMKSNLTNFQWHGQVHRIMEELGLPYCILKGIASASYYPEPVLRQMGDIDFLVRKEDLKTVGQQLESLGFHCLESKEYHHHIDYQNEFIMLEMHFDSPGIPKGEVEPVVRKYLDNLLEESHLAEGLPFPVRVPSAFHHGLVMLLHVQEHLMKEGIGLRHLCDWAVFIQGMDNEEFNALFRLPLQEMGLWKFAQIFSLASVLAFGIEKREWMGEEEETAMSILEDILSGGTGGGKDSQRLFEGMFISDSRKLSLHKGRICQLLETASQSAYGNWPIMRRWKIMLPIGWLMLYIRREVRVMMGKRIKIDYLEAYKKSTDRKELYQKLKVFEKDGDA